jgi:hypothetical protein
MMQRIPMANDDKAKLTAPTVDTEIPVAVTASEVLSMFPIDVASVAARWI